MAAQRDYYEVLGVSREATSAEIKKAYKKLALKNHPDRNKGDDEAIVRFKEAAEAFEVLGDDDKRARFDRFGHAGVSGGSGAAGGFHDVSDIFDAFGDIFDGFGGLFGGGRGGRSASRPQKGNSLQASIQLELLDVAIECKREVEITRSELCDTCDGSGAKPGTTPKKCDYCGGAGQVIQTKGFFRVQTTCPACRGQGTVIQDKCGGCHGSGRNPKDIKLDVTIPAGVDNGMQLCLRGEGEPGANRGPRGDLYLTIQVKEHPLFERDGNDLTCHVPITYTQAALGSEMEIPILEGRHELTIPAGTQPGEIFRLRGFGMPDPHRGLRGDLHVQVQVEVPKKLDEEQEELLRQLAELEHADVSPHRETFVEKMKHYFAPHDETDDE